MFRFQNRDKKAMLLAFGFGLVATPAVVRSKIPASVHRSNTTWCLMAQLWLEGLGDWVLDMKVEDPYSLTYLILRALRSLNCDSL